jgi:aromatic-L-amino-acid/L-tryptophan decarboxylase
MTPEEFRTAGHQLIDWIAHYRTNLDRLPVRAQVEPGQVRRSFADAPPGQPITFDELLSVLDATVVPGVTQVQSPMHFGWFPANASLASVLGDIASSGLGGLGISWESCPALTEVEEVTVDWMRQLVGLSDAWHGSIQDTASTACLTALLAARERASEFCVQRDGMQALQAPLVVYTSAQAHSSIEKGALLAGFGRDNLRIVDVDPSTRALDANALRNAIDEDLRHGRVPTAIVAACGSTGVTAFDPVADIVDVAAQHGIWVHVDAAMAGSAMMLPECRHLWRGVEDADSLSWNPHKWMGTILDTSLFYVRDPEHLIRVMSTNPSYLQSSVDGDVVQYRDWGIPLGRRFRALKLWFHLALDGPEAICTRLRRDLDNARWLAAQVEQTAGWELVAPLTLQTVCVRHNPSQLSGAALDAHTLGWVDAINRSGRAFLTSSKLDDRWMVRVSVGVEATQRQHVEALWALMQEVAQGS